MVRAIIIYILIGIPIWLILDGIFEFFFHIDAHGIFAIIVAYVLTGEIYEHFFDPYKTVFCPSCGKSYRMQRSKRGNTRYVCRACGHDLE